METFAQFDDGQLARQGRRYPSSKKRHTKTDDVGGTAISACSLDGVVDHVIGTLHVRLPHLRQHKLFLLLRSYP